MAFTLNCPACGMKDVSSHAERCPNCGFEIQKYFIEVNGTSEKRPEIKIPDKPRITIGLIVFFVIAIGAIPPLICILPNLIAIILLLLDLLVVSIAIYLEVGARHRYNLSRQDLSAYIRLLEDDKRKIAEQDAANAAQRRKELKALPACPICGSKNNVKRISTLNRSASIATVGLASSKIGKQYECTYCKHKW